jgi:hypothetical protein
MNGTISIEDMFRIEEERKLKQSQDAKKTDPQINPDKKTQSPPFSQVNSDKKTQSEPNSFL